MDTDRSGSAEASRAAKRPHSAIETSIPRTRAATACERCRTRKTRCSNDRPACKYCEKNDLECIYSDDILTSTWQETGDRILSAINDLKASVEKQHHYCNSCVAHTTKDRPSPASERIYRSPYRVGTSQQQFRQNVNSRSRNLFPNDGKLQPRTESVETILQWSILKPFDTSASLVSDPPTPVLATTIPNLSHRELTRLATKYVDGVHIKNPILDLIELQNDLYFLSENGLDWSTRTCLVALVCAIGAITQSRHDHRLSVSGQTPLETISSPPPAPTSDSEKQLSLQFWDIAVKRLGLAISEDSIQAVQCLCLAAIWHMHQLQPIQAWKYFDLAGAAWHTLNIADKYNEQQIVSIEAQTLTIMQSLYFTIWKSEGELSFELDIPEPILENVRFPYTFPQPPDLNNVSSPAHEIAEDERSWLYYLADIACRHLMNRLSRLTPERAFSSTTPLDRQDILSMIAQAEMLEDQLHEWRKSLPAIFSFETPDKDLMHSPMHTDDRTAVLWHRYLSFRLLTNRPFVRLVVDRTHTTSLVGGILQDDPQLEREIAERVSLCMHYAVLKISPIASWRHQGTWYSARNLASSVLTLSAVTLAEQHSNLSLKGEVIRIPQVWQQHVAQAVADFEPFWREKNGGIRQILKLIESVMETVSTNSTGTDTGRLQISNLV